MTQILIDQLSKRYGYHWIIRNFEYTFASETIYGISGSNGSGKSTLIKMISGYLTPTSGMIDYRIQGSKINVSSIFPYISLAAPYTDLINEYTLTEMLDFHLKFKKFKHKITFKEFEQKIHLSGQKDKTLQHFSSGMKQKIQLALALMSDTPILLLDEPTSYLDYDAKAWFAALLAENAKDKIIIIASNDGYDLDLCNTVVQLKPS